MLWVVTALSKAKFVWRAASAHWRLLSLVGLFIAGFILGWHLRAQKAERDDNERIAMEAAARIEGENRSHSIGIDLINGTNLYEKEVRKISTSDGPSIDDASRMRIKARTDASQRARTSPSGM